MMRSMFSGVSGLRAHQTKMDVIANNIANVNTVAFKSSRVTFQEVLSQTIRGSSAPDSVSGRGGTNPMQVGLGVSIASIDVIHNRGGLQRTDNLTDMAIDGEGFFIVKSPNSDLYRFTRAGNFGLDKFGNLVTADGFYVLGWQKRKEGSVTEFDTEEPVEPLNIYEDSHNNNKREIPAKATTFTKFAGNLDAGYFSRVGSEALFPYGGGSDQGNYSYQEIISRISGEEVFKVPYTIYDKLGREYSVTINFVKNLVDNVTDPDNPTTQWFWYINDESVPDEQKTGAPAQGVITFNEEGRLIKVEPVSLLQPDKGFASDIKVVPLSDYGTDDFYVTLDFSGLTQYRSKSTVVATDSDGYASGKLVTINIGPDGVIMGIYNNGQKQALGMVALAYFENPAGLEKLGSNLYAESINSGQFTKGIKPGTEAVGKISSGMLEMSNVDLSYEFTEMITTQRGFQANSRIITTSDEMLQELVNLKR
ncbi:MAG: flagellar hook protein FlgE [Clostridiaceae bacterium]|nr:flagellar hook protein FlgE [Clostridiaceae bacterium]